MDAVIKGIEITHEDDNCYISGKTYPYRDTIKQHGGKWDSDHKRWTVSAGNIANLAHDLKKEIQEKIDDTRERRSAKMKEVWIERKLVEQNAETIERRSEMYQAYHNERKEPIWFPTCGRCCRCRKNIFLHGTYATDEPIGLITGCPLCGKDYLD